MAQQNRTDILFPVGRMVMGSLYEPRDKDAEGKALVIKNGPDAGKARVDYFFAVAIPKTAGQPHWGRTEWGQKILAAGAAAFPQAYLSPAFAWKIEDGDSTVPNKKGRKPCDNEGWRGHWIVKFSGGYAPRIVTADGSQQITEPGAVKAGYFVQVYGNVSGNGSVSQPGVFLNHVGVALAGYGEEIKTGPDLSAVGFGKGTVSLPGMSVTPLAGGFNPAGTPSAAAPTFALPSPTSAAAPAPAPTFALPSPTSAAAPAPALMVQPNPAFLAIPAATAEPVMTPEGLASGHSYAGYKQAGYRDEVLRQHGLIF